MDAIKRIVVEDVIEALRRSQNMGWLLRRVLTIWFILIGSCAAAVLLARVIQAPGALQALGFDVCDGEPCFRGVKPGTDWAKVERLLPDVVRERSFLVLPINAAGIKSVVFERNNNAERIVGLIALSSARPNKEYPFTPAAMISRFGPPCRVQFFEIDDLLMAVYMVYPTMVVTFPNWASSNRSPSPDFRFRLDMPAYEFWIKTGPPETCQMATNKFGTWQGFTTASVYYARYRRASATLPTP
jgi:hypothetical protein